MKSDEWVSEKIKKIKREGIRGKPVSHEQAVAVALGMAGRSNKGETVDTLVEHLRNNPDDDTLHAALVDAIQEEGHDSAHANHVASLIRYSASPTSENRTRLDKNPGVRSDNVENLRGPIYHVRVNYVNGRPHEVRGNGKVQRWKTRPGEFRLPIKVGFKGHGEITHENGGNFTTVDPDIWRPEVKKGKKAIDRELNDDFEYVSKARKALDSLLFSREIKAGDEASDASDAANEASKFANDMSSAAKGHPEDQKAQADAADAHEAARTAHDQAYQIHHASGNYDKANEHQRLSAEHTDQRDFHTLDAQRASKAVGGDRVVKYKPITNIHDIAAKATHDALKLTQATAVGSMDKSLFSGLADRASDAADAARGHDFDTAAEHHGNLSDYHSHVADLHENEGDDKAMRAHNWASNLHKEAERRARKQGDIFDNGTETKAMPTSKKSAFELSSVATRLSQDVLKQSSTLRNGELSRLHTKAMDAHVLAAKQFSLEGKKEYEEAHRDLARQHRVKAGVKSLISIGELREGAGSDIPAKRTFPFASRTEVPVGEFWSDPMGAAVGEHAVDDQTESEHQLGVEAPPLSPWFQMSCDAYKMTDTAKGSRKTHHHEKAAKAHERAAEMQLAQGNDSTAARHKDFAAKHRHLAETSMEMKATDWANAPSRAAHDASTAALESSRGAGLESRDLAMATQAHAASKAALAHSRNQDVQGAIDEHTAAGDLHESLAATHERLARTSGDEESHEVAAADHEAAAQQHHEAAQHYSAFSPERGMYGKAFDKKGRKLAFDELSESAHVASQVANDLSDAAIDDENEKQNVHKSFELGRKASNPEEHMMAQGSHLESADYHNDKADAALDTGDSRAYTLHKQARTAHKRAAELHRITADTGLETKGIPDSRYASVAQPVDSIDELMNLSPDDTAGRSEPSPGLKALMNCAQFLMDGTDWVQGDIQKSDDIDIRLFFGELMQQVKGLAGSITQKVEDFKKRMMQQMEAAEQVRAPSGEEPVAPTEPLVSVAQDLK